MKILFQGRKEKGEGRSEINSHFSSINSQFQRGQTLVVLLVFMAIALFVLSAAIIMTLVNSQSSSISVVGNSAYDVAESGLENGLLRLLRDPNYRGETMSVGNGTAIINVVDGNSPTVTSVGQLGNFRHTLQAQTTYSNNILVITSWKEIFP